MTPLYECPNKQHIFKVFNFYIGFQWADTIWESDGVDGYRDSFYVKVSKLWNDNHKGFNIVLWKLSVMITRRQP